MDHIINQVSIYSILLPFAAAVIRFRKIPDVYYPFLLLILTGVLNEAAGKVIMKQGGSNAISINIYCLLAAILIVWQFCKWRLYSGKVLKLIIAVFLVIWIVEILFFVGATDFCSYFIIATSFIITLLSIFMINHLIISERRNLVKNPIFIISVGFVIFFAYSLLVECLIMNSTGNDLLFQVRIYQIFDVTNIITNVLYTLAIVWMPTRLRFTLPY